DGSSEVSLRKLSQRDIFFRDSTMARQSFCVFQLAPSTPRIGGTGSGLLLMPYTMQIGRMHIDPETLTVTERRTKDGGQRQRSIKDALIILAERHGLIPTVTEMDCKEATARMASTQIKEGSLHSVTLSRLVSMLPNAGTGGGDQRANTAERFLA